ncbi:E3 ubiquitin-protein ligase TRIM71-like [Glandiceps talaboti]
MAVANRVEHELDEQFLQCPICRRRFESPKILSCFHTFCESCLMPMTQPEHDKLECPLCHTKHKLHRLGVKSLPDNRFINDLVAFVNAKTKSYDSEQNKLCQGCRSVASNYCVTCGDHLCGLCGKIHKNMTVSRTHYLVELHSAEYEDIFGGISPFQRPIVCPIHPSNELKLYCETCKVPICLECALLEPSSDGHKGHKNSHLKMAVEKRASGLRDLKNFVDRRVIKVKRNMDSLQSIAENLISERNELGMEIHEHAQQLIRLISDQEETMLKDVKMKYDIRRKLLTQKYNNLELHLASLQTCSEHAEGLLGRGNNVGFLYLERQAEARMRELVNTQIEIEPEQTGHLHFIRNESLVQNIIEKEIGSISSSPVLAMMSTSRQDGRRHAQKLPKLEQVLDGQPVPKFRRLLKIRHDRGSDGYIRKPRGILVTQFGYIMVADPVNSRVVIYDSDGNYKRKIFLPEKGTFKPVGMCLIGNNEVAMTDKGGNNRIVISDLGGNFKTHFGQGELQAPVGIAASPNGKIYVIDKEPHFIKVYRRSGKLVRQFGGAISLREKMRNPSHIAITSTNNLVIADADIKRVLMFDSHGRFLYSIGSTGKGSGEFTNLRGLALDKFNNIFVCSEHRLQMFRDDGTPVCRVDSDDDALIYPNCATVTDSYPYKVFVTGDEFDGYVTVYQLDQ